MSDEAIKLNQDLEDYPGGSAPRASRRGCRLVRNRRTEPVAAGTRRTPWPGRRERCLDPAGE